MHYTKRPLLVASGLLFLLVKVGCAASGDAGADDGPLPQPAICERYITCVTAAMPTGVPPLLDLYGPNGSCWKLPPADAALCEQQCQLGIKAFNKASSAPECNECLTNADCKDPAKPVCTGTGTCRECDCEDPCHEAVFCGDESSYSACVDSSCASYCSVLPCNGGI